MSELPLREHLTSFGAPPIILYLTRAALYEGLFCGLQRRRAEKARFDTDPARACSASVNAYIPQHATSTHFAVSTRPRNYHVVLNTHPGLLDDTI